MSAGAERASGDLVAGSGGVLVIGIGNELLRDDGLGVHVARSLAASAAALPPSVEVVEAGLALLDLAPEMARRGRVVLVDAVRAGRDPGTVCRLELDDELVSDLRGETALSLHQWGLADTLRAIALMGMLPPRITVLGAEPAVIEPGLDLSPPCAAAAGAIVSELLAELSAGAGGAATREEGARTSGPAEPSR